VSCDRIYPYLIHLLSYKYFYFRELHDIFILISNVRPIRSMVISSTSPSKGWSCASTLVPDATASQANASLRSSGLGAKS